LVTNICIQGGKITGTVNTNTEYEIIYPILFPSNDVPLLTYIGGVSGITTRMRSSSVDKSVAVFNASSSITVASNGWVAIGY